MKFLSALLIFATVSAHAADMPQDPNQANHRFELMKCTSPRHGTIWASFGHFMSSGDPTVKYFPTEIVVFGPDLNSRWVYPSIAEALKIDLLVIPGHIHFQFTVPHGNATRTHLLQLTVYDKRIPNAYVGNWAITEPGVPDSYDQISCSAD